MPATVSVESESDVYSIRSMSSLNNGQNLNKTTENLQIGTALINRDDYFDERYDMRKTQTKSYKQGSVSPRKGTLDLANLGKQ